MKITNPQKGIEVDVEGSKRTITKYGEYVGVVTDLGNSKWSWENLLGIKGVEDTEATAFAQLGFLWRV